MSKTYIFLVTILVLMFVIQALAVGEVLSYKIWWLDDALHFLGGAWVASLAFWFLFEHKKYKISLPFWIVALGVVSFAVLGGVLWEFYEFSWDYFVAIPYGAGIAQLSLGETLSDLFFDLAGAVVASMYFLRYYRFGSKTE